jgi:hypothetical protein
MRATSRWSPGRTDESGAIGDWLVNNFYALDSESEKGILPAPVPLDNYLADLNSGQSWYRPSQMLVLVLADERAAALVQSGLNRIYNQFWRHQLPYRHATDELRRDQRRRSARARLEHSGARSRGPGRRGIGVSLRRRSRIAPSRRRASPSITSSRTRRGSCPRPRSRNAALRRYAS